MQKKASMCESSNPHHFPTPYIERHSNHKQLHKQNLFHVYKEMLLEQCNNIFLGKRLETRQRLTVRMRKSNE